MKLDGYLTWDKGDDRAQALALHSMSKALKKSKPVFRSKASNPYFNVAPLNVSMRDEFTREDYDTTRESERIPTDPKGIMKACNDAYRSVGIVKSIIDTMVDFTCAGAVPVHPDAAAQDFLRAWWKKVKGNNRLERFTSNAYRRANIVVSRRMGTMGGKKIPVQYRFQNPCKIDLVSEEMAAFLGTEGYLFTVRLPRELSRILAHPKDDLEKMLAKKVPPEFVEAAKRGNPVLLDPDNTLFFSYRKDDDEVWADPIIYSILPSIQQFKKNQLADLAALDGVISSIRVWKLGSLEHQIVPNTPTILRLAEMLANNVGGGVLDLVWGPDLELEETSTEAYKFLGEAKYGPCLKAIYAGLGIPPSLVGASEEGGFTNNFFSLKVLVERLKQGRLLQNEFLQPELDMVCRAGGYEESGAMQYDRLMTDENVEKTLIRDLLDRDIVSPETAREMMEFNEKVELARLKREGVKRKKGSVPPKASPFHGPQHRENMEKIFAGTGEFAPSEFGIDLDKRRDGDESPKSKESKRPKPSGPGEEEPKGQPGQGRPKNSKDVRQRRRRTPFPRTSAFVQRLQEADSALAEISSIVTPAYLTALKKKNLRELTDDESRSLEDFKFSVLFNASPTKESVKAAIQKPLAVPAWSKNLLDKTLEQHAARGKKLTLDILRKYQASVYALWQESQGDASGDGSPEILRVDEEPSQHTLPV